MKYVFFFLFVFVFVFLLFIFMLKRVVYNVLYLFSLFLSSYLQEKGECIFLFEKFGFYFKIKLNSKYYCPVRDLFLFKI